jgi:hypothetical protein
MAKPELDTLIADLKLSVNATFVPWSQSRNKIANPKLSDYSLNWKVTLLQDGREILTTDYSAGIAHCPSYAGHIRYASSDAGQKVIYECEHGKRARNLENSGYISGRGVITPDTTGVIWSLVQDTDALNYNTYEEFADSLGYDADSRKGEAIYRVCLETALRLRNGLGEANLTKLQEAGQDY